MPTDLLLPQGLVPSNLHLPEGARAAYIDSDVFMIADRLREISPDLHVFLLTDDEKYSYVITEYCLDGVERLVFKVKELDGRVLKRLDELMAKPLQERFAILEAENHRFEEQEKERELDDLYERVGRPMWTELEKTGFIQRPVSYPKAGVASPGKAR